MSKGSSMKIEDLSGPQVGPRRPLTGAEASSHAPASRIVSGSISYLFLSVLTPPHSLHYASKIDLSTETNFALLLYPDSSSDDT